MKAHIFKRVRPLLLVAAAVLTVLTLSVAYIGAPHGGTAGAAGGTGWSLLSDGGGPGTGG